MAYIYAFRLGDNDLFKIGQTTLTPAKRRSSLQTAHDVALTLFDSIETDEQKAAEKYIKDTWAHRRSTTGGKEVFRLTETEAAQLFAQCREWLAEVLPKQRRTAELEALAPEATVLASDDTTVELREQWLKAREEEVRLRQALDRAAAEREKVEIELKLAIGTASGINGVATWEAVTRRRINPSLVEDREPDLFAQCQVARLDAAKFEAALKALGRGEEYETFQDAKQSREFRIIE